MAKPPPWIWARLVKAVCGATEDVALLTPTEKLVYCEMIGLCKARAYMTYGAGAIGRRLGVTGRTIQRAWATLEQVGLTVTRSRGEGLSAARYPTMPVLCRPKVRRLDEDGLEHWATKLAHHITRRLAQTHDTDDVGGSEPPHLGVA